MGTIRRALAVAVVALLAVSAARVARAESVKALVLEQEVRGIPGTPEGSSSRQRLLVDGSGRRLILEGARGAGDVSSVGLAGGPVNRVILRTDLTPPQIIEVIDAERRFRARSADLNKLQEERDLLELSILQNLRKLTVAEQRKSLERNHLRPGLERVVEVTRGGTKELLGRSCTEVKVTENGRVVVHAWVTTELDDGGGFYALYQGLGAFSKQVLEKVKSIRGVPLEATIKVVTAAPTYEIRATCVGVERDVATDETRFQVPEGYAVIVDKPSVVPCPICGKEVEWDEPGGGIHVLDGREYRTCSPECRKKMSDHIRETIRKRREARGAGGTGGSGGAGGKETGGGAKPAGDGG